MTSPSARSGVFKQSLVFRPCILAETLGYETIDGSGVDGLKKWMTADG
jgi:hypothetical protein